MIGFFGGAGIGITGTASSIAVFQTLLKGGLQSRTEQFKKRSDVQREIEYFRENAPKVTTTDGFFKDRRLHSFALSAYNLESELAFPARSKQVMMSDPSDPRSLARRMTAPAHREIATDFGFYQEKTSGETEDQNNAQKVAKLHDKAFVEKVISKYVTNEFEQDVGASTPSVSDALYFRRKISTIRSAYELIGDGVMLGVVLDGQGIPRQATAQSVDRLKAMIEKGFDLERAKKDPVYVDKFLNRFIVMRDLQQMQSGRNPLLGLFGE